MSNPKLSIDGAEENFSLSPSSSDDATVAVRVTHRSNTHVFTLSSNSTVHDLQSLIESNLDVPVEYQKLFIPKRGLLKPDHYTNGLHSILSEYLENGKKSINLIGSFRSEVEGVKKQLEDKQKTEEQKKRKGRMMTAKPNSSGAHRGIHTLSNMNENNKYTFQQIVALQYFTDPPPSFASSLLTRLAQDPGIVHIMQTRKFSVGLLTEMDPTAPYANTHQSKLLGLNVGNGQTIQLRLRTDDLEGFRDYRTIRRTLVHELVHNVYGGHGADFWRLYRELEKEVEKVDKSRASAGRRLVEGEYYEGDTGGYLGGVEDEHIDEGGWTGGEYVLGSAGSETGTSGGDGGNVNLSKREVLARAAEERLKRMRRGEGDDGAGRSGDGSGS